MLAVVAKAGEDGQHDEHHHEERPAVLTAAALLIWVVELCQVVLPVLECCVNVASVMLGIDAPEGAESAASMVNQGGVGIPAGLTKCRSFDCAQDDKQKNRMTSKNQS